MNGYVEATEWYPNGVMSSRTDLVVVGWAVDELETRPQSVSCSSSMGSLAAQLPPTVERPDIEEAYDNRQALRSGFRGQVSHFSQTENCELRVFALAGESAVELEISERARSSFLGC